MNRLLSIHGNPDPEHPHVVLSINATLCGNECTLTPLCDEAIVAAKSLGQPNVPVVIVGDVHGCLEEFQELLVLSGYSESQSLRERPIVVLVGDLVNKGPYSVETVRYCRRIGAFCVRGNHDDTLIHWALIAKGRKAREANEMMMPPKYEYLNALDSDDLDWLVQLPYSITIPQYSARIVHAGIVPGVPLEHQRGTDLYRMRNVIPQTSLDDDNSSSSSRSAVVSWHGTDSAKEGVAWAENYADADYHVFFGHDAKRGLQHAHQATGLDTGCCYGNAISSLLSLPSSVTRVCMYACVYLVRTQADGLCAASAHDRAG